jgi:hypothetical protein
MENFDSSTMCSDFVYETRPRTPADQLFQLLIFSMSDEFYQTIFFERKNINKLEHQAKFKMILQMNMLSTIYKYIAKNKNQIITVVDIQNRLSFYHYRLLEACSDCVFTGNVSNLKQVQIYKPKTPI